MFRQLRILPNDEQRIFILTSGFILKQSVMPLTEMRLQLKTTCDCESNLTAGCFYSCRPLEPTPAELSRPNCNNCIESFLSLTRSSFDRVESFVPSPIRTLIFKVLLYLVIISLRVCLNLSISSQESNEKKSYCSGGGSCGRARSCDEFESFLEMFFSQCSLQNQL